MSSAAFRDGFQFQMDPDSLSEAQFIGSLFQVGARWQAVYLRLCEVRVSITERLLAGRLTMAFTGEFVFTGLAHRVTGGIDKSVSEAKKLLQGTTEFQMH